LDAGEECDDGNTTNDDGCDSECLLECGNGVLDGDEECDDGNTDDGDGCDAECLTEGFCGDGVLDVGLFEECDDGNNFSGDGCSAACQIESSQSCTPNPPTTFPEGTYTIPGIGAELLDNARLLPGDAPCEFSLDPNHAFAVFNVCDYGIDGPRGLIVDLTSGQVASQDPVPGGWGAEFLTVPNAADTEPQACVVGNNPDGLYLGCWYPADNQYPAGFGMWLAMEWASTITDIWTDGASTDGFAYLNQTDSTFHWQSGHIPSTSGWTEEHSITNYGSWMGDSYQNTTPVSAQGGFNGNPVAFITTGAPGKLFWGDPAGQIATYVGDVENYPWRFRCESGVCFVTSFSPGNLSVITWPDQNQAPVIRQTGVVVGDGTSYTDIKDNGDGTVTALSTGWTDNSYSLTTVNKTDGSIVSNTKVTLASCNKPPQAMFLNDTQMLTVCSGDSGYQIFNIGQTGPSGN